MTSHMESIRQIYRIGHGPSSSHTMGPMRAAKMFVERIGDNPVVKFKVTLYGSLAAPGKGHFTDAAILDVLSGIAPVEINWKPDVFLPFHPNGMCFEAFDADGGNVDCWTVFSIGGGTLANEEFNEQQVEHIYDMSTISDILAWCDHNGYSYWEYVEKCEGKEIWEYLEEVWNVMQ